MPKDDAELKKMREICLALPDTKETFTWGEPHFRVGEKIFAGYGTEKGRKVAGFKLERAHAAAIVERPGFRPAAYVGHAGWVSMDVGPGTDWDGVRDMVLESYRLIAPKRSQAKLAATATTGLEPRAATKRRAPSPKKSKAAPGKSVGKTAARRKPR